MTEKYGYPVKSFNEEFTILKILGRGIGGEVILCKKNKFDSDDDNTASTDDSSRGSIASSTDFGLKQKVKKSQVLHGDVLKNIERMLNSGASDLVAVKRFHTFDQNDGDAQSESQKLYEKIKLYTELKHQNLGTYKDIFVEETFEKTVTSLGTKTDAPSFEYTLKRCNVYGVMEFCSRGTLGDAIHKRQKDKFPFDQFQLINILEQLCYGLSYLHDTKKLIHRNLKPSNVLVSSSKKDLTYKICSFECLIDLKSKDELSNDEVLEDRNSPLHSTIAPELVTDTPAYNHTVDLYSLGCLMFQLITLDHHTKLSNKWAPLNEKSLPKALNKEIESLPYGNIYSKEFRNIVSGLISPKPKHRTSVEDILKQVNHIKYSTPLNFAQYQRMKENQAIDLKIEHLSFKLKEMRVDSTPQQ